jgi:hypothetical protein
MPPAWFEVDRPSAVRCPYAISSALALAGQRRRRQAFADLDRLDGIDRHAALAARSASSLA